MDNGAGSLERKVDRRRLIGLGAAGTAMVAGFALAGSRFGLAQQDETATPEAATPEATPVDATPEPDDDADDETSFTVIGVDIAFDVDEMTIPADTDVTVEFINEGAMQHDWVVEDTEFGTSMLSRDESETITVNLPAGEYTYLCTVPGHAPAGMVGTLFVE